MLPELATDHFTAIGAEGVRQRLEAIIFFDRIDHDVRGHPGKWDQEFVECRKARIVVLEDPAPGNSTAAPMRGSNLVGRYTDQKLVSHSRA
ncbi:hypothetical protein D3C83_16430 [compost metagenome]